MSLGGDDEPFGDAETVFQESFLTRLLPWLGADTLQAQVFFTDRLSDRTLAGCLVLRRGGCVIAINSRFRVDPEMMMHTLVEEFTHVKQINAGVDFEGQKRQFTYQNRPYEIEAKQTASQALGYEPADCDVLLVRDAPPGPLFDALPNDSA